METTKTTTSSEEEEIFTQKIKDARRETTDLEQIEPKTGRLLRIDRSGLKQRLIIKNQDVSSLVGFDPQKKISQLRSKIGQKMKQQKQSGEGEQEQLEIDEHPSSGVEHGANLDMPAEETKQNQLFSRKGNSNNMLKMGKTATNFLLSPIKSTLKLRGTIISSKGKPLTGEEHLHKSRQNGAQPLATLAIPSPQAAKILLMCLGDNMTLKLLSERDEPLYERHSSASGVLDKAEELQRRGGISLKPTKYNLIWASVRATDSGGAPLQPAAAALPAGLRSGGALCPAQHSPGRLAAGAAALATRQGGRRALERTLRARDRGPAAAAVSDTPTPPRRGFLGPLSPLTPHRRLRRSATDGALGAGLGLLARSFSSPELKTGTPPAAQGGGGGPAVFFPAAVNGSPGSPLHRPGTPQQLQGANPGPVGTAIPPSGPLDRGRSVRHFGSLYGAQESSNLFSPVSNVEERRRQRPLALASPGPAYGRAAGGGALDGGDARFLAGGRAAAAGAGVDAAAAAATAAAGGWWLGRPQPSHLDCEPWVLPTTCNSATAQKKQYPAPVKLLEESRIEKRENESHQMDSPIYQQGSNETNKNNVVRAKARRKHVEGFQRAGKISSTSSRHTTITQPNKKGFDMIAFSSTTKKPHSISKRNNPLKKFNSTV